MTDTKDDLIERLERRAASLRRVAEGAVRVNGAIAVMGEALQANTDADLHDEAARALHASAGREMECATQDCGKPATVHFERGGVGSHYCHDCYMRVQALAAPTQGGGE